MRILILLLIFAIGFSGFSAAAHAFDSPKCGQSLSAEKTDGAQNDCASHLKNDSKEDQTSKDAKHSCISCGHCCTAHATITQFSVNVEVPVRKTAFTNINSDPDDDFISGLKRPPRILS
ncbi:MAG: hypothetical protein AB7G80_05330 [Dongiaceae bacterium]